MAIKGSLKEASLPDVIQLLFLGRRSGCLSLADRQRHGSIYFQDGWRSEEHTSELQSPQ